MLNDEKKKNGIDHVDPPKFVGNVGDPSLGSGEEGQVQTGTTPPPSSVGQPAQGVVSTPVQNTSIPNVTPMAAPNIFTSGGVRGAFEPVLGSSVNVNWNEVGKQPVGWTPAGRPVYEQNEYNENKRPPLKTAAEQMRAPQTSAQVYTPEDVDITGKERLLNDKPKLKIRNIPEFQKDAKKKDGGFLNWLGHVFKGRPGQREGETDDEYDERITRNNMRMATVANALRHMANLYYTSKGGIPQQFNDPNTGFREGLALRKAEREKKRAIETANQKAAAEQAYKNAQLQLQRDKADADKYYKNMSLYYNNTSLNFKLLLQRIQIFD